MDDQPYNKAKEKLGKRIAELCVREGISMMVGYRLDKDAARPKHEYYAFAYNNDFNRYGVYPFIFKEEGEMLDKQEATARLDAIEREAKELGEHSKVLDAEAKALRAIIKAEPKREPRGLCWVWDGAVENPHSWVMVITRPGDVRRHCSSSNWQWDNAIPLTDDEMRTYRGRWE